MKRGREVKRGASYFRTLRVAESNRNNRALMLLSHEDILQTMLAEHPYTLLQLLNSAKALRGLLKEVPHFWYTLLDAVIIKETGERNWAFYAWEWHTGQLRHWMQRVLQLQEGAPLYRYRAPWFRYLRLLINVERDGGTARYRRQMPWTGDDWCLPFGREEGDNPHDYWEIGEEGWQIRVYNGDTDENRREADAIRAELLPHPPAEYLGHGADIMPRGDARSTSLCEIASYRMRDETFPGNWWNTGPLSVLSLRMRQTLCRVYTYFHPFALGPFELLDTRRLWLHRLYLAFVMEGGDWVVQSFELGDDVDNLITDRLHEHFEFYELWIEPLGGFAGFIADKGPGAEAFQFEVLLGPPDDGWNIDAFMTGADDEVVALIQGAVGEIDRTGALRVMPAMADWRTAQQPVFTQTRALLAEGMPAAGTMLELESYKQHLLQYYSEPAGGEMDIDIDAYTRTKNKSAAARRLLERELAYLQHAKGRDYVVQHFGCCVGCGSSAPPVNCADCGAVLPL